MLISLQVKNYAIIKEAIISFDKKLNIITGETGAGKSILMGALGLILGERADTRSLMNADDKCVVEGTFHIRSYGLKPFFTAYELDYDDTCILRREIMQNGKTRAFINDTPVNLNQLKELGEQLVDIISQHQTLQLNESAFQLSIVDAVAETQPLADTFKKLFGKFKQTEKELRLLVERESKARQDEDYFRFMLNELHETNPLEGEQEELEKKLDVLSNAENIQQSASFAHRGLDADEQSVIDQLRNLKTTLAQGAKHHPQLAALSKRIESSMIELKDIAAELESIAETTQANPQELEHIEQRLQLLFNLQKKHRTTTNSELIALRDKIAGELDNLGSIQHEIEDKEKELAMQKADLTSLAVKLSGQRIKAIPAIEKKVNELLAQVQMPDARIRIENRLLPESDFHTDGIDRVELLFAANKGSSFQVINKVASGGELSRLMLCIKSLISDKVALPTIIFDEIDTGISGEAALKVSAVMKRHANNHQVIAITHLPQIAGKADAHFFVYKTTNKHTTNTHIRKLDEHERVEEIARMLHGENPSEKVLEAARELLG